jgi:Protein N-terminal asparagine amidohydrolase
MVIANSDSTNTLVSLDHGLKRIGSLIGLYGLNATSQTNDFRQTALLLPEDSFGDDGDSFQSCYSLEDQRPVGTPLYLPTLTSEDGGSGVDDCLRCIPQVIETCDLLLSQPPVHFSVSSKERVLYVGQGEVAHAVPLQCDVIMSDKATTCHILILRSSSDRSMPLVSLTHIDATCYDDCIRSMVQHHADHHLGSRHSSFSFEEEKKENETAAAAALEDLIQLEIHVVGGFEDASGSSRKISNWLINLLADIASHEKTTFRTTLETCAISSLNESGHGSPMGRGLAMDVRSGRVFLAKYDHDDHGSAGPDMCLRSVRLWSSGSSSSRNEKPKLHLIHHERTNELRIEPFRFAPFRDIDALLALPDDILIQYTSSSPDCEEEDFCRTLRQTLHFLRNVSPQHVFGKDGDETVVYRRVGHANTWKRA